MGREPLGSIPDTVAKCAKAPPLSLKPTLVTEIGNSLKLTTLTWSFVSTALGGNAAIAQVTCTNNLTLSRLMFLQVFKIPSTAPVRPDATPAMAVPNVIASIPILVLTLPSTATVTHLPEKTFNLTAHHWEKFYPLYPMSSGHPGRRRGVGLTDSGCPYFGP